MEDSSAHSWKFDRITQLLEGVHAFVMKNIKGKVNII